MPWLNSSLELQLPRHGTSHRGLQVIPEVLEPLDLALQGLLASHPVFETFGERLETGFSAKNENRRIENPRKNVEKVPKSLENGQKCKASTPRTPAANRPHICAVRFASCWAPVAAPAAFATSLRSSASRTATTDKGRVISHNHHIMTLI